MKQSTFYRHCLAFVAVLVFTLPLSVLAAPPGGGGGNKVTVTAADPSEAFQDQELDVIVTGSGFDAGSAVRYLVTGTADASQVDVLSVQFLSSTQLRTRIRPKPNALPTDYDIEVQNSSGRKGKGTTLFRVKQKGGPPPPPPPPTEPGARYWHAFTDNGSSAPDASRLYLFGGDNASQQPTSDLWYFSVADADWFLAQPSGSGPGPRKHVGLSCGGGVCVVANGSTGIGDLAETWIFNEQSAAWSQVSCKRPATCQSARRNPTIAYDSARFYHVLFGGISGSTNLGDTYTYANATGRWTRQSPSASPSPRRSAAAAFVGGSLNRVVLFGGQVEFSSIQCDMWSWTGTTWSVIQQVNPNDGPCLHSHSMVWDGARLVVTGGYVDWNDTPNDSVWTFTLAPDGKSGTWAFYPHWLDYFGQCVGSDMIRPGNRMALDRPSGIMVFFGGVEGAVAYDDLTLCL